MNAKETKRRGIEYCKKHAHTCIKCPLLYNICIDWSGRFIKSSPTDDYPDFEKFSEKFNVMIKEIYKDDISDQVRGKV